jgi:hypothetical protein
MDRNDGVAGLKASPKEADLKSRMRPCDETLNLESLS